jgi:hypothetical protein
MSNRSVNRGRREKLLDVARERWDEEEARLLKPALERVAEAIYEVEGFELNPDEEPWKPSREA